MYEDIITLMIVLLSAVIAWAVSKLLKRNGNWLIFLKIAPRWKCYKSEVPAE